MTLLFQPDRLGRYTYNDRSMIDSLPRGIITAITPYPFNQHPVTNWLSVLSRSIIKINSSNYNKQSLKDPNLKTLNKPESQNF
jgi:hypothetical protein